MTYIGYAFFLLSSMHGHVQILEQIFSLALAKSIPLAFLIW